MRANICNTAQATDLTHCAPHHAVTSQGQPPADPNPLYLGPLSFGPTADLTLRNMVGTGQRLRPGWAFVNKSDGTKLHKAKCGNNEECSWYHYDSLAGEWRTGDGVLGRKRVC